MNASSTLQTAVLGVGGYAGGELARLLLAHPRLQSRPPLFLGRGESAGVTLTALHPQLGAPGRDSMRVHPFSWELIKDQGIDLLFLATPHEQSREWVPDALERGLRVVDLSGAWRLSHQEHRAVYEFANPDSATAAAVQDKSVYGLPELHRDRIPSASLVANPGCYATAIILALKPLVAAGWLDLHAGIVCDAKSGVSGAGKAATAKTHFMYAAENLSAYGLFGHRHLGEMYEQLGVNGDQLVFTPHLLPIPRGILATTYVRFLSPTTADKIADCYKRFYAASPMVRLYPSGELPQIQFSVRTNYCDIGFQLAPDGRRCILISCLDNLLKGAAGQAVENMNLMYGWQEAEGLV